MNLPIRVFVASASEGLELATAVSDALQSRQQFEARLWNAGTFKPSLYFIDSLEAELAQCDFGVLTLTPDDWSLSRGELSLAPRDNVLFELGLVMGHLGRERTYFVYDKKQKDLKIPNDLLGINPATYERGDGQNLQDAIRNTCSAIADRMVELGTRQKYSPEAAFTNTRLAGFCQRIAGTWWARQWPSDGGNRLALFRITLDDGANTVRLDGETFDETGMLFGRWRSTAIGLRVTERTLFWAWEGTHPKLSPGEIFAGFGQYTFDDASGLYERADGLFADIQKARKKAVRWTSVELRRVDQEDLARVARVMKESGDGARAAEVINVLSSFTRLTKQ
jgi:hypothetical protein